MRTLSRIMLILLGSTTLYAGPGCVSKSCHLACANDTKEFHYVKCTCPCAKKYRMFADGSCSQCLHKQDPRKNQVNINVVHSSQPVLNINGLRAAAPTVKRCHSLL